MLLKSTLNRCISYQKQFIQCSLTNFRPPKSAYLLYRNAWITMFRSSYITPNSKPKSLFYSRNTIFFIIKQPHFFLFLKIFCKVGGFICLLYFIIIFCLFLLQETDEYEKYKTRQKLCSFPRIIVEIHAKLKITTHMYTDLSIELQSKR